MIAKRVDDLVADAEHRVERIHCPLGNQRDRRQAPPDDFIDPATTDTP